MSVALRSIGERVRGFLSDALTERVPDRDIPAAQSILSDFVDVLAANPADAAWQAARREAVRPAAKALAGAPEHWSEAVKLAEIYLHNDLRHSHPRADRSVTHNRDGNVAHPVEVDLASALLAELILAGSTDERLSFFSSVDDWQVILAIQTILPGLELTAAELATLVGTIVVFGQGDGALGSVLLGVREWSERHPRVGMQVVTNWLSERPETRSLTADAILMLVEGVVRNTADVHWRDSIIQRLDQRGSEPSRRLALALSCFAWPRGTDPERRYEDVIRRVGELPELLVPMALWAMAREARDFPVEATRSALQIENALPSDVDPQRRAHAAALLAEVARSAARTARQKDIDLGFLRPVISRLIPVPSHRDAAFALDTFLVEMVSIDEQAVRAFVAEWLVAHSSELLPARSSFRDIFTLLVDKDSERADGWIVDWMISPQPALRLIAATLFGQRRSQALPQSTVSTWKTTQASAFAYILVSGETLVGNIWVPALVELGIIRRELLGVIKTLLLDDAAEQYPGTLRQALSRWESAEPWISARNELVNKLDERTERWQKKSQLAEFFATRPAADAWNERQQRELDAAARDGERLSIFRQIATRVPIARGESSSWSGVPGPKTQFQRYEWSMEAPLVDLIDPVAAKLRRFQRRQEAERLIAEASEQR